MVVLVQDSMLVFTEVSNEKLRNALQGRRITIYFTILIINYYLLSLDKYFLFFHLPQINLEMSILTYLSRHVILYLSLFTCNFLPVTIYLQLFNNTLYLSLWMCYSSLISHFWHVTLNMSLMTCHSWHVNLYMSLLTF